MKQSKNLFSMEAKELMIGDWVECVDSTHKEKVYAQIDAIEEGQTCILVRLDNCNWFLDISFIKPISLTSEILEKNGFIANKHVYPYLYYEYEVKEDKLKVGFAFPQGNRTSYKEPWVYIDSERIFVEHLPCVFVHQLQHALSLCEIEKEIVL